jgi:hypothetical protein
VAVPSGEGGGLVATTGWVQRIARFERAGYLEPSTRSEAIMRQRDPDATLKRRWWPTVEMLEAGIDLLTKEWDVAAIRTGGGSRAEIAEPTFHFFGPLLDPHRANIEPLEHVVEMIADAEKNLFATDPSPEHHRRHLATQLSEIVRRLPLPEPWYEAPPQGVVALGVANPNGAPPALDPEGVCGRCHAFGTVARVTKGRRVRRTTRYCASCWREIRVTFAMPFARRKRGTPLTAYEHIAFMDRFGDGPTETESRSWDDILDLVRLFLAARDDAKLGSPSDDQYSQFAAQIAARADGMDGPMPAEIEAFVQQHAPGA